MKNVVLALALVFCFGSVASAGPLFLSVGGQPVLVQQPQVQLINPFGLGFNQGFIAVPQQQIFLQQNPVFVQQGGFGFNGFGRQRIVVNNGFNGFGRQNIVVGNGFNRGFGRQNIVVNGGGRRNIVIQRGLFGGQRIRIR